MNVTKQLFEQLSKLSESLLHSDGSELPNPVPISVPGRLERPLTLQEQIQRLMRIELSRQASVQGNETFDEANDLDPDEDESDDTAYTVMEDEFLEPNLEKASPLPQTGEKSAEKVPIEYPEPDIADPQPTS